MNQKTEYVIGARDDTKAGIESAKANIGGLSAFTIAKGAAVGIVLADVATQFAASLARGVTDTAKWADALDELTQKTGLTAEAQQSLNYAANIGGASAEKLEVGLKKLAVNMSAATASGEELTDETKGASAAFAAMGLSIEQLRKPTDEVLLTIAEKFSSYEDGAKKVALATAVFGKSGAELIPFLNNGRGGIERLRQEAEKLGVVMSGDKVKELAAFNDDLDRLKVAGESAARMFVSAITPAVSSLVSNLVEGKKAFGGFWAASASGVWGSGFGDSAQGLQNVNEQLGIAREKLLRLKAIDASDPKYVGNAKVLSVMVQKAEADVAELGKKAEYFGGILDAQNKAQVNYGRGSRDIKADKTAAPSIGGAGGKGSSDDPTKKLLDGALKDLEAGLAKERDAISFQQQYMDAARSQDFASVSEAFEFKKEAYARDLQAQLAAYDAQIKALENHRSSTAKLTDQQDDTNKIAELRAKQLKAQQDAAQKQSLLDLEQQKGQSGLNTQLKEFLRGQDQRAAQLAFELSLLGKTQLQVEQLTAARKIELDTLEKIRQAQEKAGNKAIDSEPTLAAMNEAKERSNVEIIQRRQLDAQNSINRSVEDGALALALARGELEFDLRIMGKSTLEAEKLVTTRRIQLQLEADIRAARKQGGDGVDTSALEAQAQQSTQQAISAIDQRAAQQNDPWLQATESLRRYGEEASNVGKQIGSAMDAAMRRSEDAIVNFVMTGKLNFGDFAKSVIADLIRIEAKQMTMSLFSAALSFFGGPSGAAGASASGPALGSGLTFGNISGARAAGGPVGGGQSYLVGEKGPEIFTPSSAGNIIPNHKLGGMGGMSLSPTYQINIDSRSDRADVYANVQAAIKQGNADLVGQLTRQRRI